MDVTKYLIAKSASVNARNNGQSTALHHLAHLATARDTVEYLLSNDMSLLHLKDLEGNTALHIASREGRLDVVRYLVEQGADVNSLNAENYTTLHMAAHWGTPEVVEYLLDHQADRDAVTMYGDTSLRRAALSGRTETVKVLLARGAPIDQASSGNGFTALHNAAHGGHLETVKYLLEVGADITAEASGGKDALVIATAEGRTEVSQYLQHLGKNDVL